MHNTREILILLEMKHIMIAALAATLAYPSPASAFDPFNIPQSELDAMFREGQRQWEEHQRKKEAEREKAIRKGKIVVLTHNEKCIFRTVAQHMNIALRSNDSGPAVYYASQIEFSQFQDAVKAEKGNASTYETVTTIFLPKQNAVYLADDADFYPNNRTLDDILAHEFAHYFQYHYKGAKDNPKPNDDELEDEAGQVQFWFRETVSAAGMFLCAP